MCRIFFIIMMAVIAMVGNSCMSVSGEPAEQQSEDKIFPIPRIPMLLSDPQDRMTYILLHYWDNIDFKQRVLCEKDEMLEQGFVDFLFIFRYVDSSVWSAAVGNLVRKSVVTVNRVAPLMALASKYLYHPESPMLNEEHYRLFVEEMMKCGDRLEPAAQERLRMELETMNLNRVGTLAADFSYRQDCGKKSSLYAVKGPMTLLMFYDPECESCAYVLSQMRRSEILARRLENCQLRLLVISSEEAEMEGGHKIDFPKEWICGSLVDLPDFDEGYVLRALPSLFLLDEEKRVLIKEMPFEMIEEYLKNS